MTHTPGPWRLDATGRAVEAKQFDGSWRYVVDKVRGASPEQTAANARLIVAADDLLDACRAAEVICSAAIPDNPTRSTDPRVMLWVSLREKVRAAIAKAEGK